ncbi:DUF1684 domain-containing protein [Salinibacterium sp. UTAS2018]|uniref:DUF1684 domain-containing protein n=1 Tax=Salinibacterium sp. UTAS2018 TaxID=2508880 RepID=UPI0010095FCC|nr:DUF1684 domain-containing protein [Salinibacterium sp. UTAS2018]QAV70284.1 DUF1684 domain-containing protein [Salinibacterium sp. UTAS2018]
MTALQVADWRRRNFALYAAIRENPDAASAHADWRAGRDEMFATHPASPLLPEDLRDFTGLPFEPYDSAWRFEASIVPGDGRRMDVETGTDGVVPFDLLGTVEIESVGSLDVWRLASYGGGIFIPVKDALSRVKGGTYGGGRYLLDTVKGADLGPGSTPESLVLDFNFAYNPSCAYDPAWACPLAQAGNTLAGQVPVGERY